MRRGSINMISNYKKIKNPLKKAGMLGKDSETKRVKDLRMKYIDVEKMCYEV